MRKFEPSIKATAIRGGDWITTDPSNPNSNATVLRLHIDVLAKVDGDAEKDEYIRMRSTGVEIATPAVAAIVGGDRNTLPVKFGDFQVCYVVLTCKHCLEPDCLGRTRQYLRGLLIRRVRSTGNYRTQCSWAAPVYVLEKRRVRSLSASRSLR